jgi:Flp pilus assembly protein TadG
MAIMMYAMMLFFVVAVVGLAVDVGTIFMIKARLSAAVDAAALAAGRSVNLQDTVAEAQAAATTTANQFFSANFPTGYFNSIGTPTVTPTFVQATDGNGNPNGVLNIQVAASVTAPTYFMNIFNVASINVASTGTASRRGLVLMLVLDISSSMNTATSPTACQAMVTAAQNFLTLLSPYDQVGLVEFNLTATMMDSPSTSRTQVNTDIGNITCGSNTNTISGLELAYEQIKKTNLPLALNEIILFTDGSPNGITASFPVRAAADSIYGPALNTPNQPAGPAPPNQTSCSDTTAGGTDANGINNEQLCNMPVLCSNANSTIYGALAQWGDQNSVGGTTYGVDNPTSGVILADAPNAPDAMSLPSTCNITYNNMDGTGSHTLNISNILAGTNVRQFIAYIPDSDAYGNSLHGVSASGTSPFGSVVSGMETRDFWLFQVNSLCSPDPTVNPNCKNTGGAWSGFATTGSGSNFFAAGTAYAGKFRPDQPNTIVAAAMNGTMAEAYRIRSDTTYHPVINTIYLTGNGTDSVDHEFLAVVSNAANVLALPYDSTYDSANDPVLYANPAYQTTQETGQYLVTADKNQLTTLFAKLASESLRLSQ